MLWRHTRGSTLPLLSRNFPWALRQALLLLLLKACARIALLTLEEQAHDDEQVVIMLQAEGSLVVCCATTQRLYNWKAVCGEILLGTRIERGFGALNKEVKFDLNAPLLMPNRKQIENRAPLCWSADCSAHTVGARVVFSH